MTEHTESNLLICPECKETFKWDDNALLVEDKDAYYHEGCIEIYPATYLIMDKNGNTLGMVDTDTDMASSIMDEGDFVDIEGEEHE